MNLTLHARACIVLNLLSFGLVFTTFFLSFFHYSTDLKIGLFTVSFSTLVEDTKEVEAFISLPNAIESCESNPKLFSNICSALPNFRVSGVLYFLLSLLVEICLLMNALGLWWILHKKTNFGLEASNYAGTGLYIIALIGYSALCMGTTTVNSIKIDTGIGLGICIALLMLANSFYFYCVIKSEFSLEFEILFDIADINSRKIENVVQSSVTPKIDYETGHSAEEYGLKSSKTRYFACQAVQVSKDDINDTLKDNITNEIETLIHEKQKLEESTGNLKRLLESTSPDIVVYQATIESKNSEISTCKNLISTYKSLLAEKDIKIDELERQFEVNKSMAGSPSPARSLSTAPDSMIDRLTTLHKELELQRDINQQLSRKNYSSK